MSSQIDSQLTAKEKAILALYLNPQAGVQRTAILSVGYAVGAGVFTFLAIWDGEPRYAIVVYLVLLVVIGLRIWRGPKLAGVMPGIIRKYEAAIGELRK